MRQKVGEELNITQLAAICINRGDVEYYRYVCQTEDGRYVWIESGDGDRPGFAVWYAPLPRIPLPSGHTSPAVGTGPPFLGPHSVGQAARGAGPPVVHRCLPTGAPC